MPPIQNRPDFEGIDTLTPHEVELMIEHERWRFRDLRHMDSVAEYVGRRFVADVESGQIRLTTDQFKNDYSKAVWRIRRIRVLRAQKRMRDAELELTATVERSRLERLINEVHECSELMRKIEDLHIASMAPDWSLDTRAAFLPLEEEFQRLIQHKTETIEHCRRRLSALAIEPAHMDIRATLGAAIWELDDYCRKCSDVVAKAANDREAAEDSCSWYSPGPRRTFFEQRVELFRRREGHALALSQRGDQTRRALNAVNAWFEARAEQRVVEQSQIEKGINDDEEGLRLFERLLVSERARIGGVGVDWVAVEHARQTVMSESHRRLKSYTLDWAYNEVIIEQLQASRFDTHLAYHQYDLYLQELAVSPLSSSPGLAPTPNACRPRPNFRADEQRGSDGSTLDLYIQLVEPSLSNAPTSDFTWSASASSPGTKRTCYETTNHDLPSFPSPFQARAKSRHHFWCLFSTTISFVLRAGPSASVVVSQPITAPIRNTNGEQRTSLRSADAEPGPTTDSHLPRLRIPATSPHSRALVLATKCKKPVRTTCLRRQNASGRRVPTVHAFNQTRARTSNARPLQELALGWTSGIYAAFERGLLLFAFKRSGFFHSFCGPADVFASPLTLYQQDYTSHHLAAMVDHDADADADQICCRLGLECAVHVSAKNKVNECPSIWRGWPNVSVAHEVPALILFRDTVGQLGINAGFELGQVDSRRAGAALGSDDGNFGGGTSSGRRGKTAAHSAFVVFEGREAPYSERIHTLSLRLPGTLAFMSVDTEKVSKALKACTNLKELRISTLHPHQTMQRFSVSINNVAPCWLLASISRPPDGSDSDDSTYGNAMDSMGLKRDGLVGEHERV
ncbi:hypothetical protein HMN09_00052700 [Mycena chlorophos]|uniref:Uncharacterized protein n=1 Tax=Mycena chlorophos TaxID=658473 RepID=A0A8H6TPG2_MYCCL|nr:hypothetical protein HMN09_00052700 [Mycena chlorophos]